MNVYVIWYTLLLARGQHAKVYDLITEERLGNRWRSDAKWWAGQQLIEKYGYHKCPGCKWPTRVEDEHLQHYWTTCSQTVRNAEEVVSLSFDPTLPWDKQLEASEMLAAMPDRVAHRQGLV